MIRAPLSLLHTRRTSGGIQFQFSEEIRCICDGGGTGAWLVHRAGAIGCLLDAATRRTHSHPTALSSVRKRPRYVH